MLFGELWNERAIDLKTKCIVTVVALVSSGVVDSALSYHLQNAKKHGVTGVEIAAIITHTAMYAGWPNVKHWRGAAASSWFSHLAVSIPGDEVSNEWCESVSDAEYEKLGS